MHNQVFTRRQSTSKRRQKKVKSITNCCVCYLILLAFLVIPLLLLLLLLFYVPMFLYRFFFVLHVHFRCSMLLVLLTRTHTAQHRRTIRSACCACGSMDAPQNCRVSFPFTFIFHSLLVNLFVFTRVFWFNHVEFKHGACALASVFR